MEALLAQDSTSGWCEARLRRVGPSDRLLAVDLPGELVEEPLSIRDEVRRRRERQKVLPLPAQLVDLVEDCAECMHAFTDSSWQRIGQVDAVVAGDDGSVERVLLRFGEGGVLPLEPGDQLDQPGRQSGGAFLSHLLGKKTELPHQLVAVCLR